MRKILAVILALILVCSCTAVAEEAGDKYGQLTVGVTTAFNGNFLSDALGSNISDQDVRKLIHSYRLVDWDSATGAYLLNDQVVTSVLKNGEEYVRLSSEAAPYGGVAEMDSIGMMLAEYAAPDYLEEEGHE